MVCPGLNMVFLEDTMYCSIDLSPTTNSGNTYVESQGFHKSEVAAGGAVHFSHRDRVYFCRPIFRRPERP